jgi:dihydrofolate reductase
VARLIYTALASLDGYVADEGGSWDWAMPDEQVHAFVNELERPHATHLYGRRLYEVMRFWETMDDPAPEMRDYAQLWRAAEKIVYSRSLDDVTTSRTRLVREFDPGEIRVLKETASTDIAIGGAELAGEALRAGLVDELRLLLSPVLVGGGKRALPDGVRVDLELLAERRFGNGVVHVRYACSTGHQ